MALVLGLEAYVQIVWQWLGEWVMARRDSKQRLVILTMLRGHPAMPYRRYSDTPRNRHPLEVQLPGAQQQTMGCRLTHRLHLNKRSRSTHAHQVLGHRLDGRPGEGCVGRLEHPSAHEGAAHHGVQLRVDTHG